MLCDLTQNKKISAFYSKNDNENKIYMNIIHEIKKIQESNYINGEEKEVYY